jgi:hypothetical protein
MTAFTDFLAASRRLFLLRLLAELHGPANEGVLFSAVRHAGFGSATRDDLRRDLDLLRTSGAVTEEWIETIRIVTLTERGEDCAAGRVAIEGVEHSVWRR